MLQSGKNDPRIIRTRNLIQDAFMSLASEKDFEAITVKDIADRATINRATFYAHFEDKYALLDNLISETFTNLMSDRIKSETNLTEETLKELILIMCEYNDSINSHCRRIYRSDTALIDSKVQHKLQAIIINLLKNEVAYTNVDIKKKEIYAIMISSSIYFATNYWYKEGKFDNASALVAEILPFVINGMKFLH